MTTGTVTRLSLATIIKPSDAKRPVFKEYDANYCEEVRKLTQKLSMLSVWVCCDNLKNYGYKKGSDYSLPLCDSGGIQTHNLLIRSQMLYSVELRNRRLALISEMRCKGTHFLRNHQNFSLFF